MKDFSNFHYIEHDEETNGYLFESIGEWCTAYLYYKSLGYKQHSFYSYRGDSGTSYITTTLLNPGNPTPIENMETMVVLTSKIPECKRKNIYGEQLHI